MIFKRHLYLLPILVFLWGCSDNRPVAEKGMLDLTKWDFYKDGSVNLNGEWEFYWNQLLQPADFDSLVIPPKNYQKVPSIWKGYASNEQKRSGYGYATYRLKIKQNLNNEIFAIKIGEVFTTYRIWVNGKQICSAGAVGTDASSSTPQYKSQVTPFKIDTDEIEIVLQISNFHYKDGGMKDAIEYGLESYLTESRERSLIFNYFLFGSVLIMGLYHLALTLLSKHKQTTLLFAIFCLIVASRVLVTNEDYITYLLPGLNWQIHIKIIVFGYYVGFTVFVSFIYQLYREEFSKTVLKIIQSVGVVLSLVVLFTRASFYSHTEVYFQIMILISIVYVQIVIIKAIINKRNGALLLFTGFVALSVVTINDILYAQYMSSYQNLLPLGLFIFILLQSYILAKHFSNAVILSEELAIANHKLHESNETKDKFFSIIAHDLRGPIGNIANLLDFVNIKSLTTELLNLLQSEARNIFELMQDLLTWAQAQKGSIEIEPTNFNIYQIFEKVVFPLQNCAQQKDIQLTIHDEQKELFVFADIPSINTVIRNLVSNAIKFTNPGGSIKLFATTENNKVKVTVCDTGVGITHEKLSQLFKIDTKSTSRGTKNELGTGLGLVLCKEFVELNNGKIGVESEINKGSSFWFTLPLGAKIDKENILELIKGKQLEALIVEDNCLNLQNTITEITKANIKYDIAKDGEEAIAKAYSREYDFIFMDIELPKKKWN